MWYKFIQTNLNAKNVQFGRSNVEELTDSYKMIIMCDAIPIESSSFESYIVIGCILNCCVHYTIMIFKQQTAPFLIIDKNASNTWLRLTKETSRQMKKKTKKYFHVSKVCKKYFFRRNWGEPYYSFLFHLLIEFYSIENEFIASIVIYFASEVLSIIIFRSNEMQWVCCVSDRKQI